jgi:hypothetical protein
VILNRPVYVEAIGAAPVDAYVARNGSLLPLTLRSDPLDAGGLPIAPIADEATARAVQSIAATIAAVAERVEAVAPFVAAQAKLIDRAGARARCAPAPADLERRRHGAVPVP